METTFEPPAPALNEEQAKNPKEKKINHIVENFKEGVELSIERCNQLSENIKKEQAKLSNLRIELLHRKKLLEDLTNQSLALMDSSNPKSNVKVTEIKNAIIHEELERLIKLKIPESSLKSKKSAKVAQNFNDFSILIHHNVKIIFTSYASPQARKKTEQSMNFCISPTTTFLNLKIAACKFWNLDNPDNYFLTDDAEAIIYGEDKMINNFIRDYSVRSNLFRLISVNILKGRQKLTIFQEERLKETNGFKSKRNEVRRGRAKGRSSQKENVFFTYYSGLKPYLLLKKDENKKNEKKEEKDLDSSFIMLVLIIVFFSFTLAFIYRGERNSKLDYQKVEHIKEIVGDIGINKFPFFDLNKLNNNLMLGKGITLVSSYHFIAEFVKNESCSDKDYLKRLIKGSCYKQFFNKKNRDQRNRPEGWIFQKRNKAKIRIGINTEAGQFDGSGCHYEFTKDDIKKYDFSTGKGLPSVVLDEGIRGITLLFNLYYQNENVFLNVLYVRTHFLTYIAL